MKFKNLLILVVLTSLFIACDEEDTEYTEIGNWVKKAYFEGFPRSEGTSFSINGYGYWGMGRNDDDYLSDFWKYDPQKDSWTQVKDFPGTPRAHGVSASTGSKGYAGLGYDGNNDLGDFWEYDPATNEWKQVADFPGGVRRWATAFTLGEDVYVGTGYNQLSKKYYNDFYKFNNGEWSKISAIQGEKRRSANSVGFQNKGYVVSGNHSTALNDFWVYDPVTDTWNKEYYLNDEDFGGHKDVPRYNAILAFSESKMYIIGGTQTGAALASAFEWDPNSKEWNQKSSIETNVTREGAGHFVINDVIYIVGGRNGTNFLDDCYLFQPSLEKNDDD